MNTTTLVPVRHGGRPAQLHSSHQPGTIVARDLEPDVRLFQEAASSSNTRRAYESDWVAFTAWCEAQSLVSLPAEPITVAKFIAFHANLVDDSGEWYYAPSTIQRWLASINKMHELSNLARPGAHPTVSTTMAGIKRERSRPTAKKRALLLGELTHLLTTLDLNSWPGGVIAHRDYALILLGFTGAFRRSELAALQIRDVVVHSEDGLHVTVRKSKTDQDGDGTVKALPFGINPVTCPPCAYVRWLRILEANADGRPAVMATVLAADTSKHVCKDPLPVIPKTGFRDAVFRPVMKNAAIKDRHISGNVVNDVVQRRMAALGMDSAAYGGHSLRSGFVTQSFRNGATHHEVMRQTGHTNVDTVEGYSRDGAPLLHNAVTRLAL